MNTKNISKFNIEQIYELVKNYTEDNKKFNVGVNSKRKLSIFYVDKNSTTIPSIELDKYTEDNLLFLSEKNFTKESLSNGIDNFYNHINDLFKIKITELQLITLDKKFKEEYLNIVKNGQKKAFNILNTYKVGQSLWDNFVQVKLSDSKLYSNIGLIMCTIPLKNIKNDSENSNDKLEYLKNYFNDGEHISIVTYKLNNISLYEMLLELSEVNIELIKQIGDLFIKYVK